MLPVSRRLVPHHAVIGEHLLDSCAARPQIVFDWVHWLATGRGQTDLGLSCLYLLPADLPPAPSNGGLNPPKILAKWPGSATSGAISAARLQGQRSSGANYPVLAGVQTAHGVPSPATPLRIFPGCSTPRARESFPARPSVPQSTRPSGGRCRKHSSGFAPTAYGSE